MCLFRLNKYYRFLILFCCAFLVHSTSHALPTFSRQTEQPCSVCHLNFGELTHEGRQFKLTGYTKGKNVIPISATATASITKIQNTSSSVAPDLFLAKNNVPMIEEANLYLAGKYWENIGGYLKWTSSFANTNPIYGSTGVQTGTKV